MTLNFYAYVLNNPLLFLDPDGQSAAQFVLRLASIPGLRGLVVAALASAGPVGVGVAVGVAAGLAAIALNEMGQARAKQAAGLIDIAATHLAEFFGGSIGGRDPRPGREAKGVRAKVEQALGFIRDALKKAGGNWQKLERFLKSQGWTDQQIADFLKQLDQAVRQDGMKWGETGLPPLP